MLNELTNVATKFIDMGIKEVSFKADWIFRDKLSADLIKHFSMFSDKKPNTHEEQLDISIMGVDFLIVSEPRKPQFSGKISLNPMIANIETDGLRELQFRIQKSYWERENQIADAFARGKEDLIDWASKKYRLDEMSRRLYNAIIKTKPLYGLTLDELTWEEFYKYRGCGKKGWDEFVKLRGY